MNRGFFYLFVIFKKIVRHLHVAFFINYGNSLFTIIAYDTMNIRILKIAAEILDCFSNFIAVWERCRRKNHIWNEIFIPVFFYDIMKFVCFIVHSNGRLIPIKNNFFLSIKSQHIIHGVDIGFNITNHYFYFISNRIIDFAYSARPFVFGIVFCRIIMETNVFRTITTESKRNFFP